jgi:molecular chaperone DnaK
LPGDDKDAIDTKTTHLMTVSQKLGEKVYAASQAEQANADAGAAGNNKGNVDDDVVDAEVKEVKKD